MPAQRLDRAADILIVDDVPENLVAIEAALGDLSDNLVLANSGQEALRHLLDRDFALILLDVQMPSMDGIETARLIRKRERTRHVPIIFLTAYDRNDEQVLAGYRLGAVDFLFKPINAEVLAAKASVFIELRRRTAEVARQALLIQEHEQAVRERALADQRRWLEAEALRKSFIAQRRHAEILSKKNTELEHIRAQLEDSNLRLAAADRRKDEFIAVLAHELRNPLAALLSGIERLGSEPRTAESRIGLGTDAGAVLEIMRRQGHHLTRLVDDLVDISRVSSGKMRLRKRLVPVEEICGDAIELTMSALEARSHELELDCECGDALIHGDPVRLAQMVANLLSNAVRYTQRGGHIRLSARRSEGRVRIEVEDNGRGMSPELVSRVFDMFVQAEANGDGLGIGLTLVRKLARMHGGEVSAHSEGLAKGSRFELCLPESNAEIRPPEHHPVQPGPAQSSQLRVALIDDDDDVREMTRTVLEHWGHDVLEAGNGIEGVELIVSERPQLALVDIGLPDIEGYEVARRLRAKLGDDCPRLIALTGYGQEQDRARALAAGFDVHLHKPMPSEDLRSVMVVESKE